MRAADQQLHADSLRESAAVVDDGDIVSQAGLEPAWVPSVLRSFANESTIIAVLQPVKKGA